MGQSWPFDRRKASKRVITQADVDWTKSLLYINLGFGNYFYVLGSLVERTQNTRRTAKYCHSSRTLPEPGLGSRRLLGASRRRGPRVASEGHRASGERTSRSLRGGGSRKQISRCLRTLGASSCVMWTGTSTICSTGCWVTRSLWMILGTCTTCGGLVSHWICRGGERRSKKPLNGRKIAHVLEAGRGANRDPKPGV
jgi:hypothetical protein